MITVFGPFPDAGIVTVSVAVPVQATVVVTHSKLASGILTIFVPGAFPEGGIVTIFVTVPVQG